MSRAAYYAWAKADAVASFDEDEVVRVHIRGLHRARRVTYGAPRLTAALGKQGLCVNLKRVARPLHEEGLQGSPPRRFRGTTADSADTQPAAPNVLKRNVAAKAPNEVWVWDITYLPVSTGWAIWPSSSTCTAARWLAGRWRTTCAPTSALWRWGAPGLHASRRGGLTHLTARGSRYASSDHVAALTEAGIVQSMGR